MYVCMSDAFREHFGDVLIGVEEGKKENRSDPRYQITVEEYLNVTAPHDTL